MSIRGELDCEFVDHQSLMFACAVLNRDYSILQTVTRAASTANLTSCTESRLHSSQPCLCHYDICIGWYPCGLKYCRGKDSVGRIVNYRCGIKTCSRCRQFQFRVGSKSLCVWDESDFQPFFVDSAPLHSIDDPLDARGWKDSDAFVPQFVNETLSRKAGVRNPALLAEDIGGSDGVFKMNQRVVKHNVVEQVKASAIDDDDEDVK